MVREVRDIPHDVGPKVNRVRLSILLDILILNLKETYKPEGHAVVFETTCNALRTNLRIVEFVILDIRRCFYMAKYLAYRLENPHLDHFIEKNNSKSKTLFQQLFGRGISMRRHADLQRNSRKYMMCV